MVVLRIRLLLKLLTQAVRIHEMSASTSNLYAHLNKLSSGRGLILSSREIEADDVFKHTIKCFRESLSTREKEMFKEFQCPKEMLDDLYAVCKNIQKGSKLSRLCRKIEQFSSAWQPFFEITNIFVQTHPEFAGIAWGAIRLVFLVRFR